MIIYLKDYLQDLIAPIVFIPILLPLKETVISGAPVQVLKAKFMIVNFVPVKDDKMIPGVDNGSDVMLQVPPFGVAIVAMYWLKSKPVAVLAMLNLTAFVPGSLQPAIISS